MFSIADDSKVRESLCASSFLPNVFPFDAVVDKRAFPSLSPTASIDSFHFLPATFAPPSHTFFRGRGHVTGN